MKTVFFDTRTLARNAAKEMNGKFKDMGSNCAAGERWAVLIEEIELSEIECVQQNNQSTDPIVVHTDAVNHISRDEAIIALNRPGSIIGEQVLKTPNNKRVNVSWRRNMQATRLAHHIQTNA